MNRLWLVVAAVQAFVGFRVAARLFATAGGTRIRRQEQPLTRAERVSVLVPVLNEAARLEPCLEGLIAQGDEVAEIVVIDGGSSDGTPGLVRRFAALDARVRLIEAGSPPPGVNGKAWGLQIGFGQSASEAPWVLTIDADVRPKPLLVRSLLAHGIREGVDLLSVATRQRLSGAAEGLVHPALLTTLVYRFGIPGRATTDLGRVQANGQCLLIRRGALAAAGGFGAFATSVCEDVTLARTVAASGRRVGFYESDDLVAVAMYANWRDAWENWTRSLPMMDRFRRGPFMPGLAELALAQAAPLPLIPIAWRLLGRRHPLTLFNAALVACRFGVLTGTARAYETLPWTYWLSPLFDAPAVMKLVLMSRRTRHLWRGRPLVAGDRG